MAIKIIEVKDYEAMSKQGAKIIAQFVQQNSNGVLGLATGQTPEGMYRLLANDQSISWANIITFNLDEYIGIPAHHPLSYRTYMQQHLFQHINIQPSNTHLPIASGDIDANGKAYEELIASKGGIDLQLLGIGQNGHIGFNEPGSSFEGKTQQVTLTASTIAANARFFASQKDVPHQAITMGIGTIMAARKIILVASGPKKAQAIFDTVRGPVTENVPSSILQHHPDVTIIIDKPAGALLHQD